MVSAVSTSSNTPPGYSEEDVEHRRNAKWYKPGSTLQVTDQLISTDAEMSPEWQATLTERIIARYRAGYPYSYIRYNGTALSASYHTALQDWLRNTYDFPGKFGTTVFGVRVLFAPNAHTILMHVPFVAKPR
ncbi:MAG: hypothetical protein WBP22_01535 [Candidatus Saccharimonas sp.]